MNYSSANPAKIGIIGCGNIADRYVQGIMRFPELSLLGCADLLVDRAKSFAKAEGIHAYSSIEALLGDNEIDVVINITPPAAHASVTIAALEAGKHVYVEKPLAAELKQTPSIFDSVKTSGKMLGAAPDTFLGSAGQTVRDAIDRGVIGEPIGASMFVTHSKAELWHPNPTFLFQPGGGPALDLGPYYITTLVNALGPVASVAGFSRIGAPVRTMLGENKEVDTIQVTTPTHSTAILRLTSGVIVTAMLSFDVWDSGLPFIEIYGQEGTLKVPDPNRFDGDVLVRRHTDTQWSVVEPVFEPTGPADDDAVQMLRGYGVADLVGALNGQPHRASGSLAAHVLEVLEAIETSNQTHALVEVVSQVDRPAPRMAKE